VLYSDEVYGSELLWFELLSLVSSGVSIVLIGFG